MFEILEPSDLSCFYKKHVEFYEWLEKLDMLKSVALLKQDFSFSMLKDFVELFNDKNKTSIVVIEHVNCFEVQRLSDGTPINFYYKYANAVNKKESEKNESEKTEIEVLRILKEFLNESNQLTEKYDNDFNAVMKTMRIVKRSYITRRLSGVTIFKNHTLGAKEAFNVTLKSLCEKGYLKVLNREHINKTFKCTSVCFEITNEL